MARPREFDEAMALDAAMHRFWAQGYELTSVRDLAASMGITGASLYNAFGDKRTLYRRVLDHYVEHGVRDRIRRLRGLPPLAALEGFLGEIVERSARDPECRGCLLVNAALDVAPQDPGFRAAMVAELDAIRTFFRGCVTAGQADGTVTSSQPPDALAGLLLGTLLGLRVMARTHGDGAALGASVQGVLGLLAAAPAPAPRRRRP